MIHAIQIRRARLAAFAAQATTTGGANSPLQISAIRDYPLREPVSGRSYTVVKLQTRGGLEGYGECPARDAGGAGEEDGRRPGQGGNPVRNGPASTQERPPACGGGEHGHARHGGPLLKAPVYQVLGGPTRNKCRALAPLEGATDAELVPRFGRRGKRALRPSRARASGYRPESGAGVRAGGAEASRRAAGRGRSGHGFRARRRGDLLPGDAASLAAAFERFHLLWLDEPCRDGASARSGRSRPRT